MLALVVLVISSVLSGGVKNTAVAKVAPLMKAAGCSFKSVTAYVPKGQGTHVDSLTKKLPWNTSPPSNGQHNPAWAVWGFYTKPVNPRLVVHNEEHGGVDPLVGHAGAGRDGRRVARLLQREARRLVRDAVRELRQQDRHHRLDGSSRALPAQRVLRRGSHRDLHALRRGDEGGVRGCSATPTSARGRRGSRSPSTIPGWGRTRRLGARLRR